MVSVTNFRALALFIATSLCCVGTGVSQYKFWEQDVRVYLYKTVVDGAEVDLGAVTCAAYQHRMRAAYAFAIISCIVIGFAFITAVLQLAGSSFAQIGKLASTGLTAFGFVTSLIAWAIVVGTFRASPCDGNDTSIKQIDAGLDTGCQLLICTNGVLFVTLIASALGLAKEDAIELEPTSIFTRLRFVIVFIATLFVCLGTGLPQIHNDAGDWKIYLYQITTGHSVHRINELQCTTLNRRFRAAYALAIVSCILLVFTLVTLAAKANKIVSVVLSLAGVISTLIAWAIVASTWYRDGFCGPNGLKAGGFDIASGLALLVVAFVLMAIDFLVGVVSIFVSPVVVAAAAAAATTSEPSADEPAAKEEPAVHSA